MTLVLSLIDNLILSKQLYIQERNTENKFFRVVLNCYLKTRSAHVSHARLARPRFLDSDATCFAPRCSRVSRRDGSSELT